MKLNGIGITGGIGARPRSIDGNGKPVDPGSGSVPILREIEPGKLKIVGTGFYITRYGLFLTARHVIEELADWKKREINGMVLHLAGNKAVHLRKIVRASLLKTADLAIGQADNYVQKYPDSALRNCRSPLTIRIPAPGSWVATYVYPENAVLDFTDPREIPTVSGNFFEGRFLRHITSSDNPFIRHPHFETSIELKSGASGGPVFDHCGRVVGVNCRGWDFRGAEYEQEPLSSIVPIMELLPLRVELTQLPEASWERAQIPAARVAGTFTVGDLARFGHIDFDPPLGWRAA